MGVGHNGSQYSIHCDSCFRGSQKGRLIVGNPQVLTQSGAILFDPAGGTSRHQPSMPWMTCWASRCRQSSEAGVGVLNLLPNAMNVPSHVLGCFPLV